MREKKKYKGRATSGKLCLSCQPVTKDMLILLYQVLRAGLDSRFMAPHASTLEKSRAESWDVWKGES